MGFLQDRIRLQNWSKKRKVITIGVLLLVAASVIGVFTSAWGKGAEVSGEYLTTTVRRGNIENTLSGTGVIEPVLSKSLTTKAEGKVQEIMVEAGDYVEENQVIMQVENKEVDSSVRQAELEWEIAQIDLNDMTGDSAQNTLDRKKAELKVEQYQIALEEKEKAKEDLLVKAPFACRVLSLDLREGEEVNAGTEIVQVATADEMEVVASFKDTDINSLSEEMEAQIYVHGISMTYTGVVKKIAFVGDLSSSGTTTFEVILAINDPGEELCEGMSTYNTVYVVRDEDTDTFIYKQASGYLRYVEKKSIKLDSNGTVAEILCREGEEIREGAVIMRLENEDLDRQVREAEYNLAQAQYELEQLLNPEASVLRKQELTAEKRYMELLDAQEKLASLTVITPISGTVMSIPVGVGDEIKAYEELAVIGDYSKYGLDITIDELDISKLSVGQQAVVTVDAVSGIELQAKIIRIDQEGTTQNGITTYTVSLEVEKGEGVKGGMTAGATVHLEQKDDALLIPAEALVTQNGRNMVRVLTEDGGQVLSPVTVGINNGVIAEIVEGLEEGDKIVYVTTESSSNMTVRMPNMGGMNMGGGAAPPAGGGGQRPRD